MRSVLLAAALALLAPHAQAQAQARQPGAKFKDCRDCPEMVVVPAGKYVMGTAPGKLAEVEEAAELQPVPITIPAAFGIGRFEVTRAEYAAFIADTGGRWIGRMRLHLP